MNIQEAIKSGRRFRRINRHDSLEHHWFTADLYLNTSNGNYFNPTIEDILSNDWELEELKYTLNETNIKNWLEGSICGRRFQFKDYYGNELTTEEVIDRLIQDLKSQ